MICFEDVDAAVGGFDQIETHKIHRLHALFDIQLKVINEFQNGLNRPLMKQLLIKKINHLHNHQLVYLEYLYKPEYFLVRLAIGVELSVADDDFVGQGVVTAIFFLVLFPDDVVFFELVAVGA